MKRSNPLTGIILGSLIGALMWMALIVAVVHAGSFTVTTTADQDAAIAAMAKQQVHPPRVPGPTPPTVTPQQIVQGFVDRATAGPVAKAKRDAACAKVTSPADKAALNCAAK